MVIVFALWTLICFVLIIMFGNGDGNDNSDVDHPITLILGLAF